MTGTNAEFIVRLPDATGMKNEVIVQKTHRFPYDHMVRNCGIRLIEIESAAELEQAIGPRTAMLLFLNKADQMGQVRMQEFVTIGKKHRVPTFNDAAADVPPLDNLLTPMRLGFDLVTISGGKGIRGPQSAGLLLGRRDLIAAARLNTAPNSDTFGRGFKVNKEEMIGMLAALEAYLKHDHKADWSEWERRVKVIRDGLTGLPTVTSERFVPVIANQVPHVRVHWDEPALGISRAQLVHRLREGDPPIEVVPDTNPGIEIASWMLQEGEAEIVARRLRAALRKGAQA
jgi:D-glucosaminate-6-phosphate ammonia-lyase